jgi:RNA polymerase sigma factor (sigma-70 family)
VPDADRPLLGLGTSQLAILSGSTLHEVAQVMAASFTWGTEAGDLGTLVKLTRVVLLAPALIILGVLSGAGSRVKYSFKEPPIPWFVIGFLAVGVVASVGLLPPQVLSGLSTASVFLMVMAMGAMGLATQLQMLREAGMKVIYSGLAGFALLAALSFALIKLFGIGQRRGVDHPAHFREPFAAIVHVIHAYPAMRQDLDLLQRAQQGDPQARAALLGQWLGPLRALLRRLHPGAELDDALQEVAVHLLHVLPRFDPAGTAQFGTWVYSVVHRWVLMQRRRRHLTLVPLEDAGAVADAARGADLRVEDRQLSALLERALAELPEPQRTVFVLASLHQVPLAEIAATEGVPVGTVKSRLHRAKAELVLRLGEALDDEEVGHVANG